jgi:hypothetical protein
MAKPFSSRLSSFSGWVLVRMHVSSSTVFVPRMDGKKIVGAEKKTVANSLATVVDVGPGEYENGILVPPDPRLQPGVTVIANGSHFIRFSDIKEMEEENLCFIPNSMIVAILAPEGMPAATRKTPAVLA